MNQLSTVFYCKFHILNCQSIFENKLFLKWNNLCSARIIVKMAIHRAILEFQVLGVINTILEKKRLMAQYRINILRVLAKLLKNQETRRNIKQGRGGSEFAKVPR